MSDNTNTLKDVLKEYNCDEFECWCADKPELIQALNLYMEEKVKEARKNEASHRITDGLDRLIRLDGQWELLKILDEYKSALSVDQITDEDIKKGWPDGKD